MPGLLDNPEILSGLLTIAAARQGKDPTQALLLAQKMRRDAEDRKDKADQRDWTRKYQQMQMDKMQAEIDRQQRLQGAAPGAMRELMGVAEGPLQPHQEGLLRYAEANPAFVGGLLEEKYKQQLTPQKLGKPITIQEGNEKVTYLQDPQTGALTEIARGAMWAPTKPDTPPARQQLLDWAISLPEGDPRRDAVFKGDQNFGVTFNPDGTVRHIGYGDSAPLSTPVDAVERRAMRKERRELGRLERQADDLKAFLDKNPGSAGGIAKAKAYAGSWIEQIGDEFGSEFLQDMGEGMSKSMAVYRAKGRAFINSAKVIFMADEGRLSDTDRVALEDASAALASATTDREVKDVMDEVVALVRQRVQDYEVSADGAGVAGEPSNEELLEIIKKARP